MTSRTAETRISPDSHSMKILDRLRRRRCSKGLSQKAAAELTGFHERAIANWETGMASPSLDNICKYATALGLEFYLCASLKPTK